MVHVLVLRLLAVSCLPILFGLAGLATAAGPTAATVVAVRIDDPAGRGFSLSRDSKLPSGRITFKITNASSGANGFELCTTPVKSSTKNTCTGSRTKLLAPDQSATISVVFAKRGTYEYLSTIRRYAAAGMKGLIGVGVSVAAPTAPTTSIPPVATPARPPTGPDGTSQPCPNPRPTTVEVNEFEYAITLSQNTVPCGPVTFDVHNTGHQPFDFTILGLPNAAGTAVSPGDTATMTVTLTPYTYFYDCNECDHHFEMNGVLTVLG